MHKIHLKNEQGTAVLGSLAEALGAQADRETVLFVCPHDDDANIGAGMTIALAAAEGFNVQIAIVTDGSLGYCSLDEKPGIVALRQKETYAAYAALGIPAENIHFFGYPDGSLYLHLGRRVATPGVPQFEGYTGLQNSFTHMLRKASPARVFVPANTDLHPDHQAVHKDLLISLYHASGSIWPELGEPCPLPEVYEYPTYVALAEPPNMMIKGDAELFEKKLASIRCYASQRQIELVVSSIREAGPIEFIRNIRFALYHPSIYAALFGEKV